MKTLAVLLAIAACINAFAWREGALRMLLIVGFQGVGVLLALLGAFSYWWDGSMRPGQRSATIMVSGLVMLGVSLAGALRSAADDEDDFPRRH